MILPGRIIYVWHPLMRQLASVDLLGFLVNNSTIRQLFIRVVVQSVDQAARQNRGAFRVAGGPKRTGGGSLVERGKDDNFCPKKAHSGKKNGCGKGLGA